MKKKFPRTAKDIKGAVALNELQRAHYIIVMLSLALSFVLVVGATTPIRYDYYLVVAAVTLLTVVGIASFVTAVMLGKISKK